MAAKKIHKHKSMIFLKKYWVHFFKLEELPRYL